MPRPRPPRVTTLPNGIRVVSDPIPGTGWLAVDVAVACSALEEDPARAGSAHAVEHTLLGRGGADDPAGRLRAMDRAGAVNGSTSHDRTTYEADVLPERLDELIGLVGEVLTRPHWDEWDIERRVLQEEAALMLDDGADRADTLARRALFGPRHPYGRPIEGTPRTIAATEVRHLAALHARTYVGRRIVVAASGEVDHAALVRACRRELGGIPAGEARTAPPPRPVPVPPRGGRDDSGRSHLVVAAPAPPAGDPGWDALGHVDALLAGMWSGRLALELRERRGLAYDVWSGGSAMWGAGVVSIGITAAPAALEQAARIVGRELAALRRGSVNPQDLDTAHRWVVDQARMARRQPATRAARAGIRLLAGLPLPAAEDDLAVLAAVRPGDVARAAARVWRPSRMVAVTVGAPPSALPARLPALLAG